MSSEVTDSKENQQQVAPAAAPVPTKQAEAGEQEQEGVADEEDGEEEEEETSSTRELYEEAKRELALKHYSVAADKLAHVLEDLQDEDAQPTRHESDDPVLAQILHRYGKAVLGLAVANSGALGGGGANGDAPQLPGPKAGPSGKKQKDHATPAADPRFSFGGDAEEDDDEEDAEEPQQPEEGGEEEEDDDFALAFTVLDLARVIYEKQLTSSGDSAVLKTYEGEELTALQIKAQLAEVYNDLGDVGLETENFQQASSDYEQSLKILSPLLRPHSRRLADAQLRLGLALEFHPDTDQRPRAAEFVAAAKTTLNTRLTALSRRQKTIEDAGEEVPENEPAAVQAPESKDNGKGKGKARVNGEEQLLEKDDVASMDLDRLSKERKDLAEMIEELDIKLQEYEQAGANGAEGSADAGAASAIGVAGGVDRAALEKAISEAFLGASSNAIFPGAPSDKPVNDLSAMVKKRKPVAAAGSAEKQDVGKGKRKQEDEVPGGSVPNGSAASIEESDAKRVKTA